LILSDFAKSWPQLSIIVGTFLLRIMIPLSVERLSSVCVHYKIGHIWKFFNFRGEIDWSNELKNFIWIISCQSRIGLRLIEDLWIAKSNIQSVQDMNLHSETFDLLGWRCRTFKKIQGIDIPWTSVEKVERPFKINGRSTFSLRHKLRLGSIAKYTFFEWNLSGMNSNSEFIRETFWSHLATCWKAEMMYF
jgi:hypothetical protein